MAISQAEFLSSLESRSSAIHAALTTTATIPNTLSGEDILMAVIDSIYTAQKQINEAKTEPPYINTISRKVTSTPQQEGDQIYLVEERGVTIRVNLTPGTSQSFTSNSSGI